MNVQWLMQVCKDAGVELHVVPLTDEYWDRVVAHSIAEIKAGRTPNPDILCNSRCVLHADRAFAMCIANRGDAYNQSMYVRVMYGLFKHCQESIACRRAKLDGAHFCFCLSDHHWLATPVPSWQCSSGFDLWSMFAHVMQAILVFCRVKFGAFYEYLASHQDHKFDRIASGHYARIIRGDDPDEPVRLALAPDAVKDQTYFLAHLTQSQLSRVMFPLGSLNKACAVLCCAVLRRAVPCCAVLCCAVLCCAVLCCAVLCCAVLCCAVLRCAVPSHAVPVP